MNKLIFFFQRLVVAMVYIVKGKRPNTIEPVTTAGGEAVSVGGQILRLPGPVAKSGKFKSILFGLKKITPYTIFIVVWEAFSTFFPFLKGFFSDISEFKEYMLNSIYADLDEETIDKIKKCKSIEELRELDKKIPGVTLQVYDVDTNGSGEISITEYARAKTIEALLRKIDPNVLLLLQILSDYDLDIVSVLQFYGKYRKC